MMLRWSGESWREHEHKHELAAEDLQTVSLILVAPCLLVGRTV